MMRRVMQSAALGLAFAAAHALSKSLVRRALVVYIIAMKLIVEYRWMKLRGQVSWLPTPSNESWSLCHARNAAMLYWVTTRLEGLWVKAGQYISTRADIMPPEYLLVLSKCQDQLPPRPLDEIAATVASAWGGFDIRRVLLSSKCGGTELGLSDTPLRSFDPEPIGSASIAQVHKAVSSDGRPLVVKVQKQGVAAIILQDLRNLQAITDAVAWLDKGMDVRPVIREWCNEVPKELNFMTEASNLWEVKSNLLRAGDIGVDGVDANSTTMTLQFNMPLPIQPCPYVEAATETVLCMEFMEGWPVKDTAALQSDGVDLDRLLLDVSRCFAHQMFVDGFFNGDPHPGNLLVQRSSRASLNDRNNCIGCSSCPRHVPVLLDFGLTKRLTVGMARALAKMLIAADLNDFNGLIESFAEMEFKFNRDLPADSLDLVRFFFRDTSPAEQAMKELAELRREYKDSRLQRKIAKLKAGISRPKQRNLVDAFPEALVFVARVLNLLRGLGSLLGTKHSYLKSMTPFAYKCLLPPAVPGAAGSGLLDPVPSNDLEAKLLAALAVMRTEGTLMGCQVCVMYQGRTVVDVAFGQAGPYSRTPVTRSTLFNVFSVTKALVSALVHLVVHEGLLRYSDTIAQHWPAFSKHDKGGITVQHVLQHQAGLENAGSNLPVLDSPFAFADFARMCDAMADSELSAPPGSTTKYHYLSFGWILGGLLERVTGSSFGDLVKRRLGQPLDMEEELVVGVPVDAAEIASSGTSGLAVVTSVVDLRHLKRMQKRAAGAMSSLFNDPSGATLAEAGEQEGQGAVGVDAEEEEEVIGSDHEFIMLLSPTLFNHPRFRAGCVPSANGHCSARALATFCSALCGPSPLQIDSSGYFGADSADVCRIMRDGLVLDTREAALEATGKFGLGFQRFTVGGEATAFGHSGLGGSLVLCDPSKKLYLAITVNKLSMTCSPTVHLLQIISDTLGVGRVGNYAEQS